VNYVECARVSSSFLSSVLRCGGMAHLGQVHRVDVVILPCCKGDIFGHREVTWQENKADSTIVARRNNTCIYLKQRLSKHVFKPSLARCKDRYLIYFDYFSKNPCAASNR